MRLAKLVIGSSVLALSACGGGGSSGTTTLQANATAAANQSPQLAVPNADQNAKAGEAFNYDATQNGTTFNDPENDHLTYTMAVSPDHGDFTFSNGHVSGTPSQATTIEIRITASDGHSTISDDFNVYIAESDNNAPIIATANNNQTTVAGQAFTYDATQGGNTFSDPDGDSLTYSVSFNPASTEFTVSNGEISGTPTTVQSYEVTVTASDGQAEVSDVFNLSVATGLSAVEQTFGGRIDLANLEDYATLNAPAYVRAPNTVTNPITNAGATLGRVLFYDPALSIDDTVACASCHQQANAFSDLSTVSAGVEGGQTGRHSMRLINTIFSDEPAFFWDERAADLEDQVTRPIRDHNEHGFSGQNGRPDFNDLITKLEAIDYYQELFTFVFGDATITEARMQSALAQFVNSIVSFDSRFDEGRAQVADPFAPFPNYTFDENEGKNIFMSGPQDNGAGCRRCHADPVFSVFQDSGHIGVIGVAGDPTATDLTNTRSPSLRDVFKPDGSTNGPFMHDGSMLTMREVIDHYDNIPVPTTEPLRTEFMNTLSNEFITVDDTENLMLTDIEKDQVEAFLRTLSGNDVYTNPKWSDPF